jgi:predicted DNA-binding transcriptional regulator YafY
MLQTSARLLRLLSLLQQRRFWSGADLAERLEITGRTLRRDIDRLRELGYPVNATSGVAGGYQLGTGAALPPLLLDDDEALAVALGLRSAAVGTVVGMEEAAVRALTKLEQVLRAGAAGTATPAGEDVALRGRTAAPRRAQHRARAAHDPGRRLPQRGAARFPLCRSAGQAQPA